jgi:hypothetical protein
MRFHVGVQAANAEYNAKYFHAKRGTNMYIHAADIWVPFGKPQIIGTNEEALYVIDALCHHLSRKYGHVSSVSFRTIRFTAPNLYLCLRSTTADSEHVSFWIEGNTIWSYRSCFHGQD